MDVYLDFFDLGVIKKINDKKNQGNIPFVSMNGKNSWDGMMVTVNDIHTFTMGDKNNLQKKFGVKQVSGIFSSYYSGNDMVILIGGKTEEKLLSLSTLYTT